MVIFQTMAYASIKSVTGCLNAINFLKKIGTIGLSYTNIHILRCYSHGIGFLPKYHRVQNKRENSDIHDIRNYITSLRKQEVSSAEVLHIFKMCEKLPVECNRDERIQLVSDVSCALKESGILLSISHYNAMLKIYTDNEIPFKPSEIRSELSAKGIMPNNVTWQLLLMGYCQVGDIHGALNVLELLQRDNSPITDYMYNALIIGYLKNGDLKEAETVLKVAEEAHLDTRSLAVLNCTLLCGLINRKETDKIEKLQKWCELKLIKFSEDLNLQILYALAANDYVNEFHKILNDTSKTSLYNTKAKSLILKLVALNKLEFAFDVLISMTRHSYSFNRLEPGEKVPIGDFFIHSLIDNNISEDMVMKYCTAMTDNNLHQRPLHCAIERSLRRHKLETALKLFEGAKSIHIPIKAHYFWPLLTFCGKRKDDTEMFHLLTRMKNNFDLILDPETVRDYVIPYLLLDDTDVHKLVCQLKAVGVSTSTAASSIVFHLLIRNEITKASELAENHRACYPHFLFQRHLTTCFLQTRDFHSLMKLIKAMTVGALWRANNVDFIEEGHSPYDVSKYVGSIVKRLVDGLIKQGKGADVRKLFEHLLEANLIIDAEHLQVIKKILPLEIQNDVSNLIEEMKTTKLCVPFIDSKNSTIPATLLDKEALEQLCAQMNAVGEDTSDIKVQLYVLYARNNDLNKLMKIKKELSPSMSEGQYAYLIDTLVKNGNWEDALKICNEQYKQNSNFCLDTIKLFRLVLLLVQRNQYDDAIRLLERKVLKRDTNFDHVMAASHLFRLILNHFSDKGDVSAVDELFRLLMCRQFVPINNSLLGSRVKVHLNRGDTNGAVKAYEDCVRCYHSTPMTYELMHSLILKEDKCNLDLIVSWNGSIHGEGNAFYDLIIAYLECDKLSEACQILKIPTLRTSNIGKNRLIAARDKYVEECNIKFLRNLLQITKDTDIFDRAMLYKRTLEICERNREEKDAEELMIAMQEENIIIMPVLESTKHLNYGVQSTPADNGPSKTFSASTSDLKKLIRSGHLAEVLNEEKRTKRFGCNLENCNLLIKACLKDQQYATAKELFLNYHKTTDRLVTGETINILLKKSVKYGDVEFMEVCNDLFCDTVKKNVQFDNLRCHAYLNSNRVEEYLNQQERKMDNIHSTDEFSVFIQAFPRGGTLRIMLEKPQYIHRLKRLMLRCIENGDHVVSPTILWTYHTLLKDFAEADYLWKLYLQECGQSLTFKAINDQAIRANDVELSEYLLEKLESNNRVNKKILGVSYGVLMKVYVQKNCIPDALKVLHRALMRVSMNDIAVFYLSTVKVACLAKNIPFPYEISHCKQEQ